MKRLLVVLALVTAAVLAPAGEDVEGLVRAITSEDDETRLTAIDRLERGGPESAATLHALFAHRDARVRDAAANIARSRKDFGSFAADLAVLLRDPDAGNRWTAAYVLGKGGAASAPAAPDLVRSMLDPSLRNQVASKWAVAAMGEAAWPALVETLREPSTILAARAFDMISGPGEQIEGGEACARGALRFALQKSPEPAIRRQAARVLRRLALLGREEETALLQSALDDESPDVRIAAAEALARVPKERSEDVRRSLREGRHDADPKARAAIIEALKKLGAGEEELK